MPSRWAQGRGSRHLRLGCRGFLAAVGARVVLEPLKEKAAGGEKRVIWMFGG